MCRLLFVQSKEKISIKEYLEKFADVCKKSKEYQGHGWGLSFLKGHEWVQYKNINPIWEDNLSQFAETNRLIVHARSAFRDKDIFIENNMPFYNDKYIFIFNGELNGVKINSDGRIGAEKIFNFINRFDNGNIKEAVEKGVKIINNRTKYVRAMNFIIADKKKAILNTQFNEDEDYFTMNLKRDENKLIICSDPLDNSEWESIPNNTIMEINE